MDLENSGLKKARDRKKHHNKRDWAGLWFASRDSMILQEMQEMSSCTRYLLRMERQKNPSRK